MICYTGWNIQMWSLRPRSLAIKMHAIGLCTRQRILEASDQPSGDPRGNSSCDEVGRTRPWDLNWVILDGGAEKTPPSQDIIHIYMIRHLWHLREELTTA
jgi:hypothetical protein